MIIINRYNFFKKKLNRIRLSIQRFLFVIMGKLPESYEVPNSYNLPVHNQGNKNNCTSHAFASMLEYHLSDKLKERTLVDVDDLWEKQKKFGTATEEGGDFLDGPIIIATKYGVRFITESGKRGIVFIGKKVERRDGINICHI